MERTDPVLVPQWLRCAGNVNGGGSTTHNSDVPSAPSRYLRSHSEKDSFRSQERNPLSNSRGSSLSNGSSKHPYRNFTRNHRDKNRTGEREKPFLMDMWDLDSTDPLSGILRKREERNTLTRSQSLVSRKPTEVLPRRMHDLTNSSSLHKGTNGVYSGANVLGSSKNEALTKDFPSLATEDNQGVTGVEKIMSPRLVSSAKSLPIGNKGLMGGGNWTSALAEVPVRANNGTGHSPYLQSSVEKLFSESGVSSPAGRNMAEALSQQAEQARGAPQLPDKKQRLEELAIKQSRQLIPVTPSMPKSLMKAFNSTDKLRQPKSNKPNDMNVASKGIQALSHSSHFSNQHRAGQVRADSSAAPHVRKFLVLKPGRDNCSTTGAKDLSSSTGDPTVGPPTPTASMSPKSLAVPSNENKSDALLLRSKSLARSRSEFFNLMRKKASNGVATEESGSAVLPLNDASSVESFKEGDTPESSRATENGGEMSFIADRLDMPQNVGSFSDERNSNLSSHEAIYIDEEEAAFLRSLGWDENGGEDEGLTEDEINAFYEEYMSRRPS